MEVIQHKLLDLQLSAVEPAAGIVIAIRAALRTLPLLMLRSKAFDTTTYSAEPFGFWPDAVKKRHLYSLLSAHGLNIFLACEDARFRPTALEAEELLKHALKSIADSIRDAELACRTIEENMESYPDPRDVAHLSSNLLVCKVLGSIRSIIFSLHKLNSQRLSVTAAAEHTQLLNDHIKNLATKVNATLADSTDDGKQFVAKSFQNQRERLLTAAAIDDDNLFFAAPAPQEHEQNEMLNSADDQEKLEKDIRSYVLQAVTSSKEACSADVAAYSTYSMCDINTVFRQALLTDIELVKKYPRQDLLVQQLWLLAKPDTEAEQQAYLFGENTWQHMWQTCKREALIVDSDVVAWLDWYDNLFAGSSSDIKTLSGLLESTLSK